METSLAGASLSRVCQGPRISPRANPSRASNSQKRSLTPIGPPRTTGHRADRFFRPPSIPAMIAQGTGSRRREGVAAVLIGGARPSAEAPILRSRVIRPGGGYVPYISGPPFPQRTRAKERQRGLYRPSPAVHPHTRCRQRPSGGTEFRSPALNSRSACPPSLPPRPHAVEGIEPSNLVARGSIGQEEGTDEEPREYRFNESRNL